jgi:heme o synthase
MTNSVRYYTLRIEMDTPTNTSHKNPAFARYAWAVLVFNLLVILVGTVVRATGSGAGCGQHWPTCKGEIIPVAPNLHTIIEFTHRAVSGLDGLLVLALVVGAFRLYPRGHYIRRAAPVVLVLTIIEALLGAVLVKRGYVENNASVERAVAMSVHLCTTFFLLSSLALTAWYASGKGRVRLFAQGSVSGALGLAFVAMLVLGVSGAITALGDTLFPARSHDEVMRLAEAANAPFLLKLRVWHPYIAGSVGLYLILIAGLVVHLRPSTESRRWGSMLGWVFLSEILIGLTNVWLRAPVAMQVIHLMFADFTWVALCLLAYSASMDGVVHVEDIVFSPGIEKEAVAVQKAAEPSGPATWRDYLNLTKPRVISLLLFTTLTAAFVAAHGWPGLGLFTALFIGGYCSAGAANAFNMVIDRDIDAKMTRTAKRPTVTATIPANQALGFALVMALASFATLWLGANLLAAMLSLCGLVFYVVIYTLLLKRRTVQNIVIGGAAGCFPPLVGWAAVTGDLKGALAWYLFAIIFVWTPAHFWALALLIKDQYAAVGVPMLPAVVGDKRTVTQIILYAVITVGVSLLPVAQGLAGGLYAIPAVALGAMLVQQSWKLRRGTDRLSALKAYKYSMLYLALLFLALAVDARFGSG